MKLTECRLSAEYIRYEHSLWGNMNSPNSVTVIEQIVRQKSLELFRPYTVWFTVYTPLETIHDTLLLW